MRTFSRADWIAAQQAWDDGQFSEEWRTIRHQAALNGIIFPPSGSRFDCWDDERPSQRAMLIRAIRETPLLLEQSVTGSRSWSQVLDKLLAARDKQRRQSRGCVYCNSPQQEGPCFVLSGRPCLGVSA